MRFMGGAVKSATALALILFVASLAFPAVSAQIYGPKFLVQEELECTYWPNGSEKTGLSRTGSMYVSVPNNDDVLQYIQIELNSGYDTYSNIHNETQYANALASFPNADDWEQIYVNTSDNDADTTYDITDEFPSINLTLDYFNLRGGQDLYDNENIDQSHNEYRLVLTIANEHGTNTINDNSITVDMYFDRGTGAAGREVNITSDPSEEAGTAVRQDTDADGDYDHMQWTGTLAGGASVNVTIDINITHATHFTGDSLNLDGNGEAEFTADLGTTSTYYTTQALYSDITAKDKFARGPIRQGVDLSANGGYWYVRGFIKHMGNSDSGQNLTYNITEWRIYQVDPATGAPQSMLQYGGFNASGDSNELSVSDGRVYTTNDSKSSNTTLYNTSSTTKPYISVFFDWEVIWNATNSENNLTYINTSLDMPILYLLDLVALQGAPSGTVSPEVGGENITLNYTLYNTGADETDPGFAEIKAYVPTNTTLGDFRSENGESFGWYIHDDVKIYLNNTYQIANDSTNCVVTITQPSDSLGDDGLVQLTVNDLASCDLAAGGTVGGILDTGQDLKMNFKVESNSQMETGDTYIFWGTGQLNSSTDTEDREYFNNRTVQVAGKRLTGYKDLVAYDPSSPTEINSTIKLSVEDTSGTGITGIKFMDYVPANTISYSDYVGNVSVYYVDDGGAETKWTLHTNNEYEITDNGTAKTPDGLNVRMFEFVNYSSSEGNTTWTLGNDDYIRVSYKINYNQPGLYVLPVTIAAFDPDTGASLDTSFYGVIKVVLPKPTLPFQIDEEELRQSKTVIVGKPVIWNKGFDVYNPNAKTIDAEFRTQVFEDASDGYVSYISDTGRRVEEPVLFRKDSNGNKLMTWNTVMKPLETRNYEVTVLTPQVLEIDRDVEVLEQLPEKKVRLKMDVYLKSFAQEDYRNVILNLPISYSKIEQARDGFGNEMAFTGGKDTTSITVDSIDAQELKTVSITYVESYPTIIVTPDRDRYNLNAPVSLEILVINGGEKIDFPYMELEIYTPGMDVIFTDITRLENMEPLEKSQMYQKFVIPATAPAGNYIAKARFREDFAVLASSTGNFYVLGVEGGIPGALEALMILIVLSVLAFFSFRRLREVRSKGYTGFRKGI